MDEVEAISDGRSLHRRLPVPISGNEMARLALDGQRDARAAGAELREPAPLHRRRKPRAEDTSHGASGRRRASAGPSGDAARDNSVARRDSGADQSDDGDGGEPAHAGPGGRRPRPAGGGGNAICASWWRMWRRPRVCWARGGGVNAYTRIPSAPVRLAVDRHRIREMLLNMVTNAIKYTPQGGTIALALEQDDGAVTFSVRDSGIGIAPGDLPHIFDRFWRADPARSRTGDRPGVGLGLAITKWIAEAHGGSITVQSRPGRGSAFIVRFAASRSFAVDPLESLRRPSPFPLQPKRIPRKEWFASGEPLPFRAAGGRCVAEQIQHRGGRALGLQGNRLTLRLTSARSVSPTHWFTRISWHFAVNRAVWNRFACRNSARGNMSAPCESHHAEIRSSE